MRSGESTANDCIYCKSKRTYEMARPQGRLVVILERVCKSCRRKQEIWRGSPIELRRRRAAIRGNESRLREQARRQS